MKRIGVVIILVLAFCGLADSAYIAQSENSGIPLICTTQSLSVCNTVANSQYAHLFGVPLATYGVFFYGILFVLAALELVLFDRLLRRVLQGVSFVGAVASMYFMTIQVYVIGAFCTYCAISAVIALLILLFASLIEPLRSREIVKPQEQHQLTSTPTAQQTQKNFSMPPEA